MDDVLELGADKTKLYKKQIFGKIDRENRNPGLRTPAQISN
jgi:hypothetical protein